MATLAKMVAKQGGGKISDVLNVKVHAKKPAKAAATKKAVASTKQPATPAKGKLDRLAVIRANKITTTHHYKPEAKIEVLVKECPHVPGTYRADCFLKAIRAKTVAQYTAMEGVKEKYLKRWVDMGCLKITD